MAASERLKWAGKQHQHLATLPIRQLDPIPKRTWRKRDSHGKGARAMTAAEIAERNLKARERRDKKQRPATPERVPEKVEETPAPATPERQSLPPSTAQARLAGKAGEGRGKRKRKMSEKYREARQAGLQSLGYSQVVE